jgi:hypothetical protein
LENGSYRPTLHLSLLSHICISAVVVMHMRCCWCTKLSSCRHHLCHLCLECSHLCCQCICICSRQRRRRCNLPQPYPC